MNFPKSAIDKSIPVPLYYQLKTIVLNGINSGELKPGDMLPTEAEFAEMYELSRTTIRQAIGELVMENRLYRIKSKGTFVSKPKIIQGFMQSLDNFNTSMRKLNLTPKTEILSLEKREPDPRTAEALNLRPGEEIIYVFRRRSANDEPLLIVENHLIMDCDFIFDVDLEHLGLYEAICKNETTRITRLRRQIEAVAAGKTESWLLAIDVGHPIQLATSIGYNAEGRPVDYGIVHYRGDKNKFTVEFNVLQQTR